MKAIKTVLCIIALMLICISGFAQTPKIDDVYRVGTRFKYVYTYHPGGCVIEDENEDDIIDDSSENREVSELMFTREEIIDGVKYLCLSELHSIDDKGPYKDRCFMRVENNKVYKRPINDNLELPGWNFPVYDFDVQSSEIIKVCSEIYKAVPSYAVFLRCTGREEVSVAERQYEKIHVIYNLKIDAAETDISEVENDANFDYYYSFSHWINGIGDSVSLLDTPNEKYQQFWGQHTLVQVENNGEIYYDSGEIEKPTEGGVESVDAESSAQGDGVKYRIDGTRYVDGEKGIYIQNGKKYVVM